MSEYIVDVTGCIEEYEIEVHCPDWAKEKITRCKDCRYAEPEVHCGQTILRCRWFTDLPGDFPRFVVPDGFCYWGSEI